MTRAIRLSGSHELRVTAAPDRHGHGPAVVVEVWSGHTVSEGPSRKRCEFYMRGKQVGAFAMALMAAGAEVAALERAANARTRAAAYARAGIRVVDEDGEPSP